MAIAITCASACLPACEAHVVFLADGGARDPGTCTRDSDCAERGPCFVARCVAEFCLTRTREAHAPCAAGFCDGRGACVECTDHAQCASRRCSAGTCMAAACDDGLADGSESDVDCGGSCARRCGPDRTCAAPSDCAGATCTNGTCDATCDDGFASASFGETDVDCGGTCGATCGVGQACVVDDDCASLTCTTSACEALPTCGDGALSPGESSIDCGGPCAACTDGLTCNGDADCTSRVCEQSQCAEPRCDDGAQNASEPDVDCGGTCPLRCGLEARCHAAADCSSGVCELMGTELRCGLARCDDGVRNGQEGDVDCGGPCAARCGPLASCNVDADCSGGECHPSAHTCTPNCVDGVKTGAETDPDCGGAVCAARCPINGHCLVDGDCATAYCDHTLHCSP